MNPGEHPVERYMHSPVCTIPFGADLLEADRRMRERQISCLAVTAGADGRPVGVISRTDLMAAGRFRAEEDHGRALLRLRGLPIGEHMTNGVISVSPGDPISTVARRMLDARVHRVFVQAGRDLVGVVSTREVLRAVRDGRSAAPLSQYLSAPALTLLADAPLSVAVRRLHTDGVQGLVVVADGWPVGLFTQREALAAADLPGSTPVELAMSHALVCAPATIPLWRAAALIAETSARRLVVLNEREACGVVTGMDLVRAALPRHGQ